MLISRYREWGILIRLRSCSGMIKTHQDKFRPPSRTPSSKHLNGRRFCVICERCDEPPIGKKHDRSRGILYGVLRTSICIKTDANSLSDGMRGIISAAIMNDLAWMAPVLNSAAGIEWRKEIIADCGDCCSTVSVIRSSPLRDTGDSINAFVDNQKML